MAKLYSADEAIERGWVKPAGAERYWEGRWRDEKKENDRLRELIKIVQKHQETMSKLLRSERDRPK